jgi:uncharacterized protein (DUF1778 family)
MTTKERLRALVEDLSDLEAENALRVLSAQHAEAGPTRIELDEQQAAAFLDALNHPESFEPGLRRLFERPSALGG